MTVDERIRAAVADAVGAVAERIRDAVAVECWLEPDACGEVFGEWPWPPGWEVIWRTALDYGHAAGLFTLEKPDAGFEIIHGARCKAEREAFELAMGWR